MPIRPVDIRRKEFRNGFRGYDAGQVDDFLDTLADEFERNYNENQRMREEVSGLRDRLQQFEDLEGSIRAALVHAEQAANDVRSSANREADDVRQSARREAELTVRDAQARSHQMLADTSARIDRVQESYEALREAKRGFANDFRQLLRNYTDMMENMETSSAKEIEATLRDRLDTESIAVGREAAAQHNASGEGRQAEGTGPAPAASDVGDPGATDDTGFETAAVVVPETTPETERAGTGPLADEPPSEGDRADEEETQVPHTGEASPTDSAGAPDDEKTGRVVWSTETAGEPGKEPASGETSSDETVAEDPETETSTSGAGTAEDSAVGEPRASEEVEDQETSLAAQSRSHEFFDRDTSSSEEKDSRISRASRFLRRRD